MALSIREQVIAAVQSRLARLVASGECLRCQPYSDENEFIAVWDLDEDAESGPYNSAVMTLPLAVVYSLRYTADDFPAKLNDMLANVIKQVYLNDSVEHDDELGGLAQSINYSGSVMKYPQSGSEFISVQVVLDVVYSTVKGDPFTQS